MNTQQKNITGKLHLNIIALCLAFSQLSCKKLVEIPAPVNSISNANVFTNDETAIAGLTGFYTEMSKTTSSGNGGFTGQNSIVTLTGLSGDELVYYNPSGAARYLAYYTNTLSVAELDLGSDHWTPLYNYVFKCNSAIEGLSDKSAEVLTPAVRQQLLGEAKFLRAFFYFYLVNMYGDVPLTLTTDYQVNTILAKTPASKVYEQIITDLKEAQDFLSPTYPGANLLQTTTERVRPTKWAAIALMARAHVYAKQYPQAEVAASLLIDNTTLFGLPALNNAFLKNSAEAIWQLQPTTVYFNTEEARFFVITPNGPNANNSVYLSDQLLNSFEPGDQRAVYGNWIDSTIYKVSSTVSDTVYYPYKYKKNLLDSAISGTTALSKMTEYQMVLRLGEQYLIRAEARTHQNKLEEAKADLNAIRQRAGLNPTTATDQTSLLSAIQHERQVELFTEWGHRWFDLKRTGTVDAVMTTVTPLKSNGATTWQSYQQWYPINPTDIQRAPNLIQNPGY